MILNTRAPDLPIFVTIVAPSRGLPPLLPQGYPTLGLHNNNKHGCVAGVVTGLSLGKELEGLWTG